MGECSKSLHRGGIAEEHLAATGSASPGIVGSSNLEVVEEIAHYVRTCVKTAQRWEKIHDFLVHRLCND